MEYIFSIFSGGISGGVLAWLLRNWISERLSQSIKHEYSEKLERYKADLNSRIEAVKHENQVSQLRTSLFFDHQRNAFAELITKIAEINEEWNGDYDPDEGLHTPVPSKQYKELEALLYKHQLFLDEECLLALALVTDAYASSFPFDDRSGAPPHQSETGHVLAYVEYLQPRVASIFRNKIGVQNNFLHLREIVVLSAMKLINNYQFHDADIPPKGNLNIRKLRNAADIVSLGELHFDEMKEKLKYFDAYLSRDGGWFHEAQLKAKQCLNVLKNIPNKSIKPTPPDGRD